MSLSDVQSLNILCIKAETTRDYLSRISDAFKSTFGEEADAAGVTDIVEEIERLIRLVERIVLHSCKGLPSASIAVRHELEHLHEALLFSRSRLPAHVIAAVYDLYLSGKRLLL